MRCLLRSSRIKVGPKSVENAGAKLLDETQWPAHQKKSLLYGLCEDLDEIDFRAHEEIYRLLKEQERLGAASTWAQINAVVAKARAAAMAA